VPPDRELQRLTAWEARLGGRREAVRRQTADLPANRDLERAIARVLHRVERADLTRLAGTMRPGQRVILGAFLGARAEVLRADEAGELGRLRGDLRRNAAGSGPTTRDDDWRAGVVAQVGARVVRRSD
jgi:hypothetical protein